MRAPAKALVVTLISLVTMAFGITPATAATSYSAPVEPAAAVVPVSALAQNFSTGANSIETKSLDVFLHQSEFGNSPHNYNVEAAIALARSEVGTSRPTGWSAPGECIMSVIRWVEGAGGANWVGGGDPVSNYTGATRLTIEYAQPGDIVQYESINYPTSWASGVHTLLIAGVNGDGTFDIVQSNIPGGSGLVSEVKNWVPTPPAGFQAVVWRF